MHTLRKPILPLALSCKASATAAALTSIMKFASPLAQSPRSDILEWRFPKPYEHLVLTGRSRAAWHTSFVVPGLNLLLDAGLCVNKLRPKHVFLTHGHSDHTMLMPAFMHPRVPPDVYCPAEMKTLLDDYLGASTALDQNPVVTAPALTHGVRPGDVVSLRRIKGKADAVTAEAFACDHAVPCLGYLFSATTHPLKPEFAALSAADLQARRREGVELTEPRSSPIFAFLGDTTVSTLASSPAWLRRGVPVVITECSFLHDEHAYLAERTKHTAWRHLEPVVRSWPDTIFVLIHFSMRYTDAEIVSFFRNMRDPPSNVVVWADAQA